MFSNDELLQSVEILKSFGATKVMLFGSAQRSLVDARDLDFACRGIQPKQFYTAAGRLLAQLGKPIDLIDLDRDGGIGQHVEKFGTVLYAIR